MANNKKSESNQNFLKKLLFFEVSFFTGSMVLITAFIIAASSIPGPNINDESALEAMLSTFVSNSDIKKADIETENFRLKVYRSNYYHALQEQDEAETEAETIVEVEVE